MLVCWNGGRTEGQSFGRLVKLATLVVRLYLYHNQDKSSQAGRGGTTKKD